MKCSDPKGFEQEVDLIEVAGLPMKCMLTCLPLEDFLNSCKFW